MSLHRKSGAFTMQKDCYYTPKAMLFEGGAWHTTNIGDEKLYPKLSFKAKYTHLLNEEAP